MTRIRTASFTVEALESRILLSATPYDPGTMEAEESGVEHVDVSAWEIAETEEVQSAQEGENEEDALYENAVPAEFASLSTTTYGEGETEEPSIFKTGFAVIETGATHIFRSTEGGIFFSGPGAIDGTSPASTHEDVHLRSATEISIGGPIGGTTPIHNLVVSAGSNIFFGGSINLTGDLIIEQGAQVTFDRDVTVQGDIRIGDAASPADIGRVVFNSGSSVNAGGEIEIHSTGTVDFGNRVGATTEPSSVIVNTAGSINVEQDFFASTVSFTARNVTIDRILRVSGPSADDASLRITAENLLSVKEALEVGDGDAVLTANRVSFTGGEGSVQSTGPASALTIRPFDPARPIGIGDPSGGDFNRLQVSHVELNAINTGFEKLVIGDLENGTGEVRVGNIGLARSTSIAQIQNPATFAGGSVIVESRIDIDILADSLRLVANTGDIVVNGAINQSASERNAWVRLEAERDIFVNRPVYAHERISLTAGYSGGEGSVFIQSTGTNSGQLFTTSDSSAFTERRIEISAGADDGDIVITGEGGAATLSAFGADSSIVLRAAGGGVAQTGGAVRADTLAALTSGDIQISAADIARVGEVTLSGNTLASASDVLVNGFEVTGAGSIDLVVLNDLTVDHVVTSGGDVSLSNLPGSGNGFFLGRINADGGDIDLNADGAILDHLSGSDVVNLTTTGHATLVARHGIGGSGDQDIDTDVAVISARNLATGGIFIQNRSDLDIVNFLETMAGDGSISVTVDQGDLTVDAPVGVHGTGNLLLQAVDGNVVVDSAITAAEGHLSLLAENDLDLLSEAAVSTQGDGTLLLRAAEGFVRMDGNSAVNAHDSAVRIEANRDVVLGNVTAERIAVISGSGALLNAVDSSMNLTATELRLVAENGIGEPDRHLTLEVERLAAFAGSAGGSAEGIYLLQNGAVTIGEIAPVAATVFGADGSLSTVADDAELAGLATGSDGNIVLTTTDGTIWIEAGVSADGDGNIRLETDGDSGDLRVDADLSSENGNLTLLASAGLILAPDVTAATAAAGSVFASARGGMLEMDSTSTIRADGSGIRLFGSESVTLGRVEAADVSVVADHGSILSALDSTENVTATNLRLEAEEAVGSALKPILTTVALAAVHARGAGATDRGIFIRETSGLTVGTTGFSGVTVGLDGSTEIVEDDDQTGFVAGGDGDVELTSVAGFLTIEEGATVATQTGNLSLSARSDIRLSEVTSLSGDMFLTSEEGAILDNAAGQAPHLATGGTAHLRAAAGIGDAGADALRTDVAAVTALNTTSGLIVIREAGDLVISADDTLTSGGIRNEASDGSVLVETSGSLQIDGAIFAATGGKILMDARGGDSDLVMNAAITAEGGPVSLLAERAVSINADLLVENGGPIDIAATTGDLVIAASATVTSTNADIRLHAGNDVMVTGVDAGSGNVHISAAEGSLQDGGNDQSRDITAAGVRLSAHVDIGAGEQPLDIHVIRIAALATTGSIHLSEKDDIEIGTVPVVSVERVLMDDSTTTVADAEETSDLVSEGTGDLFLVSETGSITIEDGIVLDDLGVRSNGGDISLRAEAAIVQNAGIVTSGSGSVSVAALIEGITMADGTDTSTESGQVTYAAGGDIRLSRIQSDTGDVEIDAGDRIIDNTTAESPNLTTPGHAFLQAVHGIGDIGVADIVTNVGSLSAVNETSGRIVIGEVDGLTIGGAGVKTLDGDGDIILTVGAGDLSVQSPVAAHGDGNILVRTTGIGSTIESSAALTAENGHVTVLAHESIEFAAGSNLSSVGGGTVTLRVVAGSITIADGGLIDGGSGDIRVEAAVDVSIGGIATSGNVRISAQAGSILNNGDSQVNVAGERVRLEAGQGIGVLGTWANPVTTEAAVISARATAGGINILEATAVEVGDVAVHTHRVNPDATATEETEPGISKLVTSAGNGSVVFRTLEGGITLNDGSAPADNAAVRAHGSGNILIEANGSGAGIEANADIRTTTGNVTLIAAESVDFADGADVLTTLAGVINIEAETGSIAMHDTTRIQTGTGNIRLIAGMDVKIGGVSTQGHVAIMATAGSIVDQGDTHVDVRADGLWMNAGVGIGILGTGMDSIETRIDTLTARAGSGGVHVREANNLTIGDVTMTVLKVASDGRTFEVNQGTQSDVRTVEGDGSIVLRLTNGSMILEPGSAPDDNLAIAAHGDGNVLVETLGVFTDIFANGGIASDRGSISLSSSLQIFLAEGSEIRTNGEGTIDVLSRNGFLTMEDGARILAESGDVRLFAPADILLGGIRTDGNVSIISEFASILDNGDTDIDVEAGGLRLWAHTDIGILVPVGVDGGPNPLDTNVSALTAHASFGDVNLHEQTSVSVEGVSVTVNRVAADGTTSALTDEAQSDVRTFAENGSIVFRSISGDMVLNEGANSGDAAVLAHGSGNVLLEAGANLVANADVISSVGHITLTGTDSVQFTGMAAVVTGGEGTVKITGAAGNVIQSDGSRFTALDGDVRVFAQQSIYVGEIETNTRVSLIAEAGSILDGGNAFGREDVIADQLRIVAGEGIGEPGALLETRVTTLAARAGGSGIFLVNTDDLAVDRTSGAVVQRVNADNTVTEVGDEALSDVATVAENGSIVLLTNGGMLVLNDGSEPADNVAVSAHGSGDILLQALTPGTGIEVNADILSGSGHVTLLAVRDIVFAADADLITGGTGTVNIEAETGRVEMHDTTLIQSGDGDIRLLAEEDVLIGGIETGGDVSITATTGSILDQGDTYADVIAAGLRMVAGIGIGTLGTGANSIETTVGTLSARATSGGINIHDSTGLVIGDVEVTVWKLDRHGDLNEETDEVQSDVATTGGDGSIVIRAADGDITLEGGSAGTENVAVEADGAGNVLVEALAPEANITASGGIESGTGHISVIAPGTASFEGTAGIVTGGAGSIFVAGLTGDVNQADGSRFAALHGDVRIVAEGSVYLGEISTSGSASLIAHGGSILDSGDSNGSENVIAGQLRLVAGVGIGATDNGIDTRVATLSARAASGGVFILNTGDLVIDDTEAAIERVLDDATLEPIADAIQSDVVITSGDGSIVLRTLAGSITLNDGTASADDIAILADGTGNVLIHAGGEGSDLLVNAEVRTGAGHLSLFAGRSIEFVAGADVISGADGTINIEAGAGSIVMDDETLVATGDGTIRLHASDDVLIGGMATTGNVSITATYGSVLTNGDAYIDVTASGLRLVAGSSIGTLDNNASPLRVTVATVSARAASGDINLLESDAITVDAVEVIVQGVISNGATEAVTDSTQSDLVASGSIILRTLAGDIVLNDGGAPDDGHTIASTESGVILVEALAAGASIYVNGTIGARSGDVSIIAAQSVNFTNAKIDMNVFLAGTIYVEALAGSIVMQESLLLSAGGNIRLIAQEDVWVDQLRSRAVGGGIAVSLTATDGSILNNASEGTVNVWADNLRLSAQGGVGTLGANANELLTDVARLAAQGADLGVHVVNTRSLLVDDVTVAVNRVNADGSVMQVTDETLSGVRTSSADGSIVLRTLDGTLTLNDGTAPGDGTSVVADGAGNILLQAGGTTGDLLINADVASGAGHLTLLAGRSIELAAGADVTTTGAATIRMEADAGSVVMDDAALISSGSGDIRLAAEEDVRLGGVLTTGNVFILAMDGSVLSNGTTYTDVVADGLRSIASAGIGTLGANANPIRTDVTTFTGWATWDAAGDINILETTGLVIDSVSLTTWEVGENGLAVSVTDDVQSDVSASQGSIVLRTVAGSLVLNDGPAFGHGLVLGAGENILLEAGGANADVVLNGRTVSNAGHITVLAQRSVLVTEEGQLFAAGSGTVKVEAVTGAIEMNDASQIVGGSGAVRLTAETDVSLGGLMTTANASITARTGSVLSAGSTHFDVRAHGLRIDAAVGVGTLGASATPITTLVTVLSARAGEGGINITEIDGLAVGDVEVTVAQVEPAGSVLNVGGTVQSEVRTAGGNGSIVLRALAGSVTLNDGTAGEPGIAVSAHGSGDVRIEALSAGAELVANAGVSSEAGHITMVSDGKLTLHQAANIVTGDEGTVYLEANADLLQGVGARITTQAGDIRIVAEEDIRISGVTTEATLSLISRAGSVLNGGTEGGLENVIASGLRVDVAGAFGQEFKEFEARVDVLSVHAAAGSIYLLVTGDVWIDEVTATVEAVLADGSLESITDAARSDLRAGGDDGIVMTATSGSIVMNDAALMVAESGEIRLAAAGSVTIGGLQAPGDIRVSAEAGAILSAGTLHRSIETDGDAILSAATGIGRTGSGALEVRASRLEIDNTNAGAVYLAVEDSIELGGANLAGSGSLSLSVRGGSLTVAAPVQVAEGGAVIQVQEQLLLAAGIFADRDIRLIGAALNVGPGLQAGDTLISSNTGDVQIRALGELEVPAGLLVEAAEGDIRMQSGGKMTVGLVRAEGLIDLRSGGDLMPASFLRVGHELQGSVVRLLALGDLGKPGLPILSQAGRLDFEAGGYAEVLEADDLEIGRFGLRLADGQPGDELLLRMEGGELTAVADLARIPGLGDFILRSDNVVTLGTQLVSPDGNMIIDTQGLRVDQELPAAVAQAPNGSILLLIGTEELGPGMTFAAETFEAHIGAGDFAAGFVGTVRIGPDGIRFADEDGGAIDLAVTGGDLDLSGVLHGAKGIDLRVTGGGLNVLSDAPAGPVLAAEDASVSIELDAGVGLEEREHVEVLAGEFSALTTTGDLRFSLHGPLTEIMTPGIQVLGGEGTIDLRAVSGNVQTFGDIRHQGVGSIRVGIDNGSFVMAAGSQMSLANGSLNMEVRNLIVISEIFNLGGAINIISTHNSILRQVDLPSGIPNITSSQAPVFAMSGTINLLLDADETTVNGKTLVRDPLDDYLLVSGTFR